MLGTVDVVAEALCLIPRANMGRRRDEILNRSDIESASCDVSLLGFVSAISPSEASKPMKRGAGSL